MRVVQHCSIPLDEILVEDRLRPVDPYEVALQAALIKETGLHNSIRVERIGNQYRLVAGAHRLEAHKLLGRDDIACVVVVAETEHPQLERRFDEIAENIGRAELNALDRAAHLAELHHIWEVLYPNRGKGGDRRSAKAKAAEKSKLKNFQLWSEEDYQVFALSKEVRARTGFSERTFFAAISMWNGLSPESKQAVRGTKFADNHVQLAELAKETPDDQRAILKLLGLIDREEGQKPKASTVRQAWEIHHHKVDPRDPTEKGFDHIREVFRKSSEEVRRNFILWLASPHQNFVAKGTKYLGDRSKEPRSGRRKKVQS